MAIYKTPKEERALERDQERRAVAHGVPEPSRRQEETADEYHRRIWAAIQAASTH